MVSLDGVTGRTIFDNTGESLKELHLLQIVGDRFVELKHAGPVYSYLRDESKVIEHE
jgi:hypothetical protein